MKTIKEQIEFHSERLQYWRRYTLGKEVNSALRTLQKQNIAHHESELHRLEDQLVQQEGLVVMLRTRFG